MKKFFTRFFFSEYLSLPFSIWLIWLLLFDAPFIDGRVIEPDLGGAFTVFYVCLFYIAIQAISALANVKEGHKKLRADVWVSSLPLLVMAAIIAIWLIPEPVLASWNIPSGLTSLLVLDPQPFAQSIMILSLLVVLIDVFLLGIFAGNLRSFINQEKLASARQQIPPRGGQQRM